MSNSSQLEQDTKRTLQKIEKGQLIINEMSIEQLNEFIEGLSRYPQGGFSLYFLILQVRNEKRK